MPTGAVASGVAVAPGSPNIAVGSAVVGVGTEPPPLHPAPVSVSKPRAAVPMSTNERDFIKVKREFREMIPQTIRMCTKLCFEKFCK